MIICLETATNLCSVALCDNERLVSLRESHDTRSHASLITVFIDEILKEQGLKVSDLKAIAVSRGPGSYTGLRIGVSVAKGIAYALSIPLIGIDTTLSMFMGIKGKGVLKTENTENLLFCPMLDARRMEVYCAIYDNSGRSIKKISAEIITEESFMDVPESKKIIFFGNGADKCREIIKRNNSSFLPGFTVSAAHMLIPAYQALIDLDFQNIAYFEPFYLKDFITSKPKNSFPG
jgi:tRNA threonylcarbamoyladenosine biosynthesis protein TsaB